MLRLIRFELKKMLSRRVAVAVNIGALLMILLVMAMNVIQATQLGDTGQVLTGPAAIERRRELAQARAGEMTPERVARDIEAYQKMAYSKLDPDKIAEMSGAAAYDAASQAFDDKEFMSLYDPYYQRILSPWSVQGLEPYQYAMNVTEEMALDFYGALEDDLQVRLDDGQSGTWTYGEAERAFWTEKEAEVPSPLAYGYSGGWDNILDCAAFVILALLAICVTVTPVFASEYRDGTDAVLLAARFGRGRLVAAKLIASFVYATVYFALAAAVICAVSLACYGAEGAALPVQNYLIVIPYALNMVQAAVIYFGLYYAIALGLMAFTLALSASLSSTLPIIVSDVVLIFVTSVIPTGGNGLLRHIFDLFPGGLQSAYTVFVYMDSFPIGPVVLDLIAMVILVYGVVVLAGVPFAWRAWSRHQVA